MLIQLTIIAVSLNTINLLDHTIFWFIMAMTLYTKSMSQNSMNENSDISKLIDTIKRHSIENEDEWYRDLELRKKEEVDLHNKLRDMQFRKKATQQEIKKYFSNTKMLDGYSQNEESLLTNNQLYFEDDYLLKNSISGLSDQYFNSLIKSIAKGSVILDLASGFGRESIIAAKNSAKFVVGIDLSPLSVKEANSLAEKIILIMRSLPLEIVRNYILTIIHLIM